MIQNTVQAPVKLIGAKEAAKRLSMHRKTLYRYTIDGTIEHALRLPSGVYRYDPDYIDSVRETMNRVNVTALATG